MKTRSVFLGLVIASCLSSFVMVADGWAQERQKYSGAKPGTAKSKYTQTHVIDVGDVPGHQLRIFELHTVYSDEPPAYDGVKVKERVARGFSEYTEGSGAGMAFAIKSPSFTAVGLKVERLIYGGRNRITIRALTSPIRPSRWAPRVYASGP